MAAGNGLEIDPEAFRERLEQSACAVGVEIPRPALEPLAAYAALLLSWNERVRLTGARTVEALVDEHLVDALPLLAHIPDREPGVDVGSGGGLPGLVLAIVRPGLALTMLEPNGKKAAFLRAARRDLALPNVVVEQISLEAYLESPARELAGWAVSRATWSPADWLERGIALVRPGGVVLGQQAGEATDDLPEGTRRHPYTLLGRSRAVLVRERNE